MIENPDHAGVLELLGIRTPADAYQFTGGECVKNVGSSFVRKVRSPLNPSHSLYFKCYRYSKRKVRWRKTFRKSSARREYESLLILRRLDVSCPQPVAYGDHRLGGLRVLQGCFIITLGIDDAESLDRAVPVHVAQTDNSETRRHRRRAVATLGRMIARMHAGGFVDGDLHYRNVLYRSTNDRPLFFIIDSPKGRHMTRFWFIKKRRTIHDLACLDKDSPMYFTRCDRLRFLKAYLNKPHLDSSDRPLIDAVHSKREKLLRKRKRSHVRRPVA